MKMKLTNLNGYSFYVRDASFDLSVAKPILTSDEYVLDEIKKAGHTIKNVVDLGGHIGIFSLKARSLWPKANIYIVEPAKDNYLVLRKNLTIGKNYFFNKAIVGDTKITEVLLCERSTEHAEASRYVFENLEAIDEPNQPEKSYIVKTLSVLNLFKKIKGDIDILKVDCEGSEGVVFKALKDNNLLRRVKWIRGEWHGYKNLQILNEVLPLNHIHVCEEMEEGIGFFIAHRKDLS